MKPELQIKALAELDGWSEITEGLTKGMWYKDGDIKGIFIETSKDGINELPSYLTSYDAIIPLIQKQDWKIRNEIECKLLDNIGSVVESTPTQLCEALLRSVGKWKD